jgi:hypothetical protein
VLAFRSVQQGNHCAREEFLYELKAGQRAASGRPRPAARRPSGTSGNGRPRLKLGQPNKTRTGSISLRSEVMLGASSRTRCVNEKLTRENKIPLDGIILYRYGKSMAACR